MMVFAVQWTAREGLFSVARRTLQGALLEVERVAATGAKNVQIHPPGGMPTLLTTIRKLP